MLCTRIYLAPPLIIFSDTRTRARVYTRPLVRQNAPHVTPSHPVRRPVSPSTMVRWFMCSVAVFCFVSRFLFIINRLREPFRAPSPAPAPPVLFDHTAQSLRTTRDRFCAALGYAQQLACTTMRTRKTRCAIGVYATTPADGIVAWRTQFFGPFRWRWFGVCVYLRTLQYGTHGNIKKRATIRTAQWRNVVGGVQPI